MQVTVTLIESPEFDLIMFITFSITQKKSLSEERRIIDILANMQITEFRH